MIYYYALSIIAMILREYKSVASMTRIHPNAAHGHAYVYSLLCLHKLRHWRRGKLRSKDSIPESTGDTKSILIVHEVMLEVILLELAIVQRETRKCG